MRDRSDDFIAGALSAAGAWYPGQVSFCSTDRYELCGLLDEWMANFKHSLKDEGKRPPTDEYAGCSIPYNASPCHFILYYAPPPNRPFVVFGDDTIMFGSFGGKRNDSLNISFPIYRNIAAAMAALDRFLSTSETKSLLRSKEIKNILLRDVNEQFANVLIKDNYSQKFGPKSLKELNYSIYDINSTLALRGKDFSNLRWRLNRFNRGNHRVEHIPLSEARGQVIHLIGQWRSRALKERGFSYVDIRSDRFGARLFGNAASYPPSKTPVLKGTRHHQENGKVISRVLKVDGKIASFNLGYPLGLDGKGCVFAHAIGISDISIPGLSEYAQMDFWKLVRKAGYRFMNDGPTWRKGLAVYKDKFRPVTRERYYWATVAVGIDG